MNICTKLAVGTLCMTVGFSAMAQEKGIFFAKLSGFNEAPAILSKGEGRFKSKLDASGTELSYTLTFSNLSSDTTVAHIHFAQPGVAGAVIAFLCGGGGKPDCPINGGTVTGTITAADVLPVPAQGVNGGSFPDFIAVLRSDNGYVNIHSTLHPGGEIRGQIR